MIFTAFRHTKLSYIHTTYGYTTYWYETIQTHVPLYDNRMVAFRPSAMCYLVWSTELWFGRSRVSPLRSPNCARALRIVFILWIGYLYDVRIWEYSDTNLRRMNIGHSIKTMLKPSFRYATYIHTTYQYTGIQTHKNVLYPYVVWNHENSLVWKGGKSHNYSFRGPYAE